MIIKIIWIGITIFHYIYTGNSIFVILAFIILNQLEILSKLEK